jgi:hypothetical protein
MEKCNTLKARAGIIHYNRAGNTRLQKGRKKECYFDTFLLMRSLPLAV